MKTYLILALLLVFVACENDVKEYLETDDLIELRNGNDGNRDKAEFFKIANESIAVIDVRKRYIDYSTSVREVVLINFYNHKLPNTVNFDGEEFSDQGIGNDLVAGDGIYTSLNSYTNKSGNLNRIGEIISVTNQAITSDTFIYKEELTKRQEEYLYYSNSTLDKFVVKCKVVIADKCAHGCGTDWNTNASWCICITECEIGWESE